MPRWRRDAGDALWRPGTYISSLQNPAGWQFPMSDQGRIRGPALGGSIIPATSLSCMSVPPHPAYPSSGAQDQSAPPTPKVNPHTPSSEQKDRGHTFKIPPSLPPLNLHHHPTPTPTLPLFLLILLLPIPLPLPHSSRNLGPHSSPTLLHQPMSLLHVSKTQTPPAHIAPDKVTKKQTFSASFLEKLFSQTPQGNGFTGKCIRLCLFKS